jgi:hypothetical protein
MVLLLFLCCAVMLPILPLCFTQPPDNVWSLCSTPQQTYGQIAVDNACTSTQLMRAHMSTPAGDAALLKLQTAADSLQLPLGALLFEGCGVGPSPCDELAAAASLVQHWDSWLLQQGWRPLAAQTGPYGRPPSPSPPPPLREELDDFLGKLAPTWDQAHLVQPKLTKPQLAALSRMRGMVLLTRAVAAVRGPCAAIEVRRRQGHCPKRVPGHSRRAGHLFVRCGRGVGDLCSHNHIVRSMHVRICVCV